MREVGKMRKTLSFLGVVVLVLALAPPPAHATSGDLWVTETTTLAEDHQGRIIVDADDVTLDCAGHLITGTGDWFVVLVEGRSGVTVRNCRITAGENGLVMMNSTGPNTLVANSSFANSSQGIIFSDSDGSVLIGNESDDNGVRGFGGANAMDATLQANSATGNGSEGFGLFGASGNLLSDNVARSNGENGFLLSDGSSNNVVLASTSAGNGGNGFLVATSNGNRFERNTANGNSANGFEVTESSDLRLSHNRSVANEMGAT